MKTTITSNPQIYVACLASYNNGILHGRWIDATQDVEDIKQEVSQMLLESPVAGAEEWAIHDYSGFEGLGLSENESFDTVASMAQLIEEHGEAWVAYAQYVGLEYATPEGFEEAYQGEWESEIAFAEHIADEFMDIPDNMRFYFDHEKFARDLFIGDYYSANASGYKVHVFLNI